MLQMFHMKSTNEFSNPGDIIYLCKLVHYNVDGFVPRNII